MKGKLNSKSVLPVTSVMMSNGQLKQQVSNDSMKKKMVNMAKDVVNYFALELRGMYTLERRAAYGEFLEKYGIWYSVVVSILIPLVPMCVIMGLSSIPLNPPEEGLEKNRAFVVVNLLEVMLASSIVVAELNVLIPEFEIGIVKGLVITGGYTITHLVSYMGMYYVLDGYGYNAFPVPFTTQVGATFGFAVSALIVAFFVRNPFKCFRKYNWQTSYETPNCGKRVKNFCCLVLTQTSIIYTYAIFGAVFVGLPASYQPVALLFLPMMKFGFKLLCSKYTEEYGPNVSVLFSIFTAELFNAMYVSISIQHGGSGVGYEAIAMIILLDAFINMLYIQNFKEFSTGKEIFPPTAEEYRSKRNMSKIGSTARVFPQSLVTQNTALDILQDHIKDVQKESQLALPTRTHVITESDMRRFLYMSEYIILTEYVEIITPILYMVYSCYMFYQPNKQYIYGLREEDMNYENLMTSTYQLAIYAALELASCLLLRYKLQKMLQIDIIQMLGFVLHKHRYMVWSFVSTWAIVIMGFQSIHHGVDFTLNFKWFYNTV